MLRANLGTSIRAPARRPLVRAIAAFRLCRQYLPIIDALTTQPVVHSGPPDFPRQMSLILAVEPAIPDTLASRCAWLVAAVGAVTKIVVDR